MCSESVIQDLNTVQMLGLTITLSDKKSPVHIQIRSSGSHVLSILIRNVV
jgi:hypothetical protein